MLTRFADENISENFDLIKIQGKRKSLALLYSVCVWTYTVYIPSTEILGVCVYYLM